MRTIRRLTFWNVCSILFNDDVNTLTKGIPVKTLNPSLENKNAVINGYALVNGLNMYYEIHGTGRPLTVALA